MCASTAAASCRPRRCLMALDSAATAEKRAALRGRRQGAGAGRGGRHVEGGDPPVFYDKVVYTLTKNGWKTKFDPQRLRGVKLRHDLVNAASGKVWPRPAPRSRRGCRRSWSTAA